ncbi:hypothetical protein J2W27_003078 [Variovorax boronicumulans]|uniref:hypothetical protein n=1 Tax=Variovorax boronicumulans TaxID=436515 RepID=UPI002785FB87|nr:hypothetical protein [Variovorax boronicumulans]MDP9910962.1 hypothetical protein [Variovorax boronicumulans]
MNAAVFLRWLDMAKDDAITIDADDINAEAVANMWCFSPRDDELSAVSEEGLTELIEQLVDARRQWLLRHSGSPAMTFYCWHDAQARQLRFSLVSSSHGRLPFGCAVDTRHSHRSIAARIVATDWLNEAYFSSDAGNPSEDAAREWVCPVSQTLLP